MSGLATILFGALAMVGVLTGHGAAGPQLEAQIAGSPVAQHSPDFEISRLAASCPLLEPQITPDLCAMGVLAGAAETSQVLTHGCRSAVTAKVLPDRSSPSRAGNRTLLCSSVLEQRSGPLQI